MTDELKSNSKETNVSPEAKKRKRSNKPEISPEQRKRWIQIRLIPIWARILLVLLLLFLATITGLMIGYGFIGDGEPMDALKWGAWQHILDLVNGKV